MKPNWSQKEPNRSKPRTEKHLKRTKENLEEREIAVKSLFWGENDKKQEFFPITYWNTVFLFSYLVPQVQNLLSLRSYSTTTGYG